MENEFSEEQTEMLLKTITENEIMGSLNQLILHDTADFSSNMSVRYLATIVAKAPNLEVLHIEGQ